MLNNFELHILDWISSTFGCAFLDWLMPVVTFLGEAGWIWIVATVALTIARPTRRTGLTMALALVFTLLVCNMSLKPIVARPRPFMVNPDVLLLVKQPSDYSFPSGHTMSSFAAATALCTYYRRAGIAALALAAVIGFSRMYLYVHFPTDVLAGLLGGVGLGVLAWAVINRRWKGASAK